MVRIKEIKYSADTVKRKLPITVVIESDSHDESVAFINDMIDNSNVQWFPQDQHLKAMRYAKACEIEEPRGLYGDYWIGKYFLLCLYNGNTIHVRTSRPKGDVTEESYQQMRDAEDIMNNVVYKCYRMGLEQQE